MDPVTHLASGVLAGMALKNRFKRVDRFIPFCALAAVIPDVDNVAMAWGGPEAYMRIHRGITHSLAGAALIAFLLPLILLLFNRKIPYKQLALAAYGCMLIHIFLDCITSYGTQVLMPFSDARISFPAVFIIDPFYTAAMLLLLATGFLMKSRRAMAGALGLVWLLLYPAVNWQIKTDVARAFEGKLNEAGVSFSRLVVQPEALSPFFWKVIVERRDTWLLTGIDLLRPDREFPVEIHPKADREELKRLGKESSIFDTYNWFSDFPVVIMAAGDGLRTETFADLRFFTVNPLLTRYRSNSHPPFALTAVLDTAGRLTQYRFQRRGETLAAEVPGPM